jgi:multidrug efflux pump subunit AcrA (membrane-fusion protein)
MRNHRRTVLLAPVLLTALTGCGQKPAAQPAAPPAPTVTVVRVQKKAINRVVEQPGAVSPSEETRLFAKIPGFVKAIGIDPTRPENVGDRRLDIGSRVKAGQLLAELAVPELEEEAKQKAALVRQTEAEVEQARKALAAAEAGVASAQAQVTEAKAGLGRAQALYDRWASEVKRISELVQGGVIDQQTRDETTNQFKAAEATRGEAAAKVTSAEAGVRKSQADREKAVADVAAAEARRDVAKAEVGRLAALLGYARITAPFDGVVTHRAVNTGDFLSPTPAKEGVFHVARLDPVRVVVQVPEADAGLVAEGLPVRLTLQAVAGPELTGTVTRTSWSLEPGSRTLRAEIDLPNKDGRVRPGMYAYARITVAMPEAWAVPAAAVGKVGDEPVVYLAEGGKAARTPVQLLRGDGQFTQVVRYKKPGAAEWTDFTGAEEVATPAAALTDGQPIR